MMHMALNEDYMYIIAIVSIRQWANYRRTWTVKMQIYMQLLLFYKNHWFNVSKKYLLS